MGYERRGRGRYFYAARWVGGKVIKEYFGRGPDAEVAAELAGDLAAARARIAEAAAGERARLAAARRASRDLEVECRARLDDAMGELGFHRRNSGPWRRRRGGVGAADVPIGGASALRLVPVVEEPAARAAVAAWASAYARGEPALAAATAAAADSVRDALATFVDPAVVRLLAARAAVAWLEAECAGMVEAEVDPGEHPRRSASAARSSAAARARLGRALAELGTVARLIGARPGDGPDGRDRPRGGRAAPGRGSGRRGGPVAAHLMVGPASAPGAPTAHAAEGPRERPAASACRGPLLPPPGAEAVGRRAAPTIAEVTAALRAIEGRRGGDRDHDHRDPEQNHG